VLGFQDYATGFKSWASDDGFASRVIKCDKYGKVQFDTPIAEVEGESLEYCFEKDDCFYFFGVTRNPKTRKPGESTRHDIYMVVLDKEGRILKSKQILGSGDEYLTEAEMSGNEFVLSIHSTSEDGEFFGANSGGYTVKWVFRINSELNVTKKEMRPGRDFLDDRLGEKNGVSVYKSDSRLKGFKAGTPNAFIDYGDFYLIVSENRKGKYEYKLDAGSFDWYYTETVYSAYKNNGKLIFRASVDSTPDYEARFKYDIRDGKIKIGESSGNIIREYLY
jgi:hypothetical protein